MKTKLGMAHLSFNQIIKKQVMCYSCSIKMKKVINHLPSPTVASQVALVVKNLPAKTE